MGDFQRERCKTDELRPYLIYIKVGERRFLHELRAYFIYVKEGEMSLPGFRRIC